MRKGEKMSNEQRAKLSASRKGKALGNKNRLGLSPWNKGKKGVQVAWNKGIPASVESIKKMVEKRKANGSYVSKNKGKKNPKMNGNTYAKGRTPWNKNKPHLAVRGEKNVNWKNGATEVNRKIKTSIEYKLWRMSVFERDNFTCVWCGYKSHTKVNGKSDIHADHIKQFAFFPELRFAIDNGRTLCIPCHRTTETWGKRTPDSISCTISRSITAD